MPEPFLFGTAGIWHIWYLVVSAMNPTGSLGLW